MKWCSYCHRIHVSDDYQCKALSEIQSLREKIAEQEGRLLNQQSTIEGLKHLDAISCGCHYNKVWMGTKWDHWLVPCKEHSPKKVEALEEQLKAAREALVVTERELAWMVRHSQLSEHGKEKLRELVGLAGEALAGEVKDRQ